MGAGEGAKNMTVARSLDESATLEGSASQASSEESTLWGK